VATLRQPVLPIRVGAQDDGVAAVALGAEDVDAQDRTVANGHLDVPLEAYIRRWRHDLDRG
jgi:hypothetical protein